MFARDLCFYKILETNKHLSVPKEVRNLCLAVTKSDKGNVKTHHFGPIPHSGYGNTAHGGLE